jgi:hypothetical protein
VRPLLKRKKKRRKREKGRKERGGREEGRKERKRKEEGRKERERKPLPPSSKKHNGKVTVKHTRILQWVD